VRGLLLLSKLRGRAFSLSNPSSRSCVLPRFLAPSSSSSTSLVVSDTCGGFFHRCVLLVVGHLCSPRTAPCRPGCCCPSARLEYRVVVVPSILGQRQIHRAWTRRRRRPPSLCVPFKFPWNPGSWPVEASLDFVLGCLSLLASSPLLSSFRPFFRSSVVRLSPLFSLVGRVHVSVKTSLLGAGLTSLFLPSLRHPQCSIHRLFPLEATESTFELTKI
jgi:hypothetical protein